MIAGGRSHDVTDGRNGEDVIYGAQIKGRRTADHEDATSFSAP
jgi:hypothetical protein